MATAATDQALIDILFANGVITEATTRTTERKRDRYSIRGSFEYYGR